MYFDVKMKQGKAKHLINVFLSFKDIQRTEFKEVIVIVMRANVVRMMDLLS